MDNLKFKKGLEQNLPKELEKDTFYISTDSKKIRLNDAVWEDSDNIKNIINENEKVTANALNKLNDKLKILESTYVTYNELKTLYENSKLVVGAQYCITDYITTTSQLNTRSANHQFDIIVEAISPNVLSEEATACLHDGDTYFSHSNLTSWKLNYSLNNDTTRFFWADETNGKGVIYYMKDEFGNEAPYDFKNIQFKRNSEWLNENNDWKNAVLSTFNGTELWLYTFSYYDISLGIIDDSLTVYPTAPQHYAYNNIIKEYYRINDGKLELNNIVFVSTSESPYHNNINYGCNNLIFGNNCYNNTLGVHANNNIIGNNFYLNNVGSGFKNNKIYNTNKNAKVYSNIFLNDCQNNVFPRQFISNICGDNFIGNDFVTQTSYANLGLVTNCNFGNSFAYNVGMPYKLSNIEILNNTLLFKQSNLGNWNEIILNNGKTITSYLQDLGTILGSFKLRIGVNEYGQYFAHDVDTDGVYRLGEFSTFDGAMNAAALFNVAGNAKITKILFTSGNNNGIIEQFVHSNQSTQELTWNGGFRMRIITFTDTTRTEVSNVSDWHWSKPTELYYDISQHKIALTRFNDGRNWGLSGCFGAVEIPEATNNNAGLLLPNEKQIFAHFKHLGNFTLASDADNEAAKIENLDKKITNIFYTVNNEITGVIEQFFSNNEIYQYLVLNGIKYVRKIIVENNEVKEINGWQNINNADKITGLYYWPSTRQLCLTNIFNQSWGTTILPLATEDSDGLMSKDDKKEIHNIINITKENEKVVANSLNNLNKKFDNTIKKDEFATTDSNGIMSKEDKINLDRVNEFVYDLGVITQDANGTAWRNMLKRAAEVANNQNIGIITFKLDDNWDRNKNGVIEQQVGKTVTMQTLKWDNCESIRYITFADENKTTPQNPNQDFTHARTMPTHLYYDGNSKNLSFRQMSANGSYINGLNRSADFGTITFPAATNTISSVVKLGDDYTKTVNDTALSLQGANNLFNAVNENVNTINQIINENEEVTANAITDLQKDIQDLKTQINLLTNKLNELLSK